MPECGRAAYQCELRAWRGQKVVIAMMKIGEDFDRHHIQQKERPMIRNAMLLKRAEMIRAVIDDPGQRDGLLGLVERQEEIFLAACRDAARMEEAIADYLTIETVIEQRMADFRRTAA